jgi:hypothetical protein
MLSRFIRRSVIVNAMSDSGLPFALGKTMA